MLMNEWAGLVSAGFTAASYMLIDYSTSGSIYMLHGVLYLLWLIVVMRCYDGGTAEFISKKFFSNWQIFYLAAISAIGFMLNYQAVMLALASIVIILFLSNASWRMRIKKILFFIAIFFVFISPLMIRNYLAFGSPFFFSTIMTYVFQKAGLPYYELNPHSIKLVIKSLLFWLPHNFYYFNRKLFILTPLFYIFFMFAIVDYLFSKKLFKKMLPILLLFSVHSLISIAWPVTKFRYFVPILPIVVLISCEYVNRVFISKNKQRLFMCLGLICTIALSFLIYFAMAPTHHSYYYDGAITTDPFGRNGEYSP
jgi:hypothetical protein